MVNKACLTKYVCLLLFLCLLTAVPARGQSGTGYVILSTSNYSPQIRITARKSPCGNETGQTASLRLENSGVKAVRVLGVMTATTYCGDTKSRNFRPILGGIHTETSSTANIDLEVSGETCKGKILATSTEFCYSGALDRIKSVTYQITHVEYLDENTPAPAATSTKRPNDGDEQHKDGSSVVTPDKPERDPNATIKEQHQQNANSHLDAAENSTGLNKALNLDLAQIEAISGGDKAQMQQVQQLRNKQQAENQLALTKSVSNLLTQLQTMQAQNAERRDREHQNLVAHSDAYLQLIDFHVNQKRILETRDLYSNAPHAWGEHGWDQKKIPEKYFTLKEWDTKPTNHLDSIVIWTKQRDYKSALKFIGSITPYYINFKEYGGAGTDKGSLLCTSGTFGLLDMHYWGVFEHLVTGVICDPDSKKRRLKAFAKNTATPLAHYEWAFIKLRGNGSMEPGDTAEAIVHFKKLVNAPDNSLLYNAFLQKQAYLWLGLMAKSSAFQTGDQSKYRQAISYFDRAWQIPTAAFLEDGRKISASQTEIFNYSTALANDSYYQVLQLTLVRELAQAHYLLAEVSHDKTLYETGLNYYYIFANELTK